MNEENKQHVDFTSLRDLLTVIFKHKYVILAVFTLVFAASLVAASQIRESYEAKSVLLIKLGREFLNRPESANSGGSAIPVDSITKSEISILTSHDLMGKVVKSIGATALYPQLNDLPGNTARESAALGSFQKNLKVSMLGSTLVEVRFTNDKPQVAALAVNTLVDAFKDKHLEVFGGKSTEFLESQKKAFEDKLKESEGKLAGFEEKNRIFSVEDQRAALIEQRTTLDTSLKEAQDRLGDLERKIAFMQSAKWTAEIPVEARTQVASLKLREREAHDKTHREQQGRARPP